MTEKADELYDRRITELWFAMKSYVEAGQIRGLDALTVEEFSSRLYEWKGRKISLETKKDYKKRMGTEDGPTGSPDRADAAAIILEVARTLGFHPNAREIQGDDQGDWETQWELATGKIKLGELNDSTLAPQPSWDSDSILDSASFEEEEII